MENKEKLEDILKNKMKDTYSYGLIEEKAINLDEKRIIGKSLLNYNIYKIRCWTEKNVGLSGIQIYHKDRFTSKEEITINVIKDNKKGEEEEIILAPNEMINEISIWKDDKLRGFEVKTSKGREKKFGCFEKGKEIKLDDEFENGNNYLLGVNLNFEKIEGINSISFYYINKHTFYISLYLGYFILRVKLKNKDFKNKIEKNVKNLDYSDKMLYKSCCLPDNQFFAIFKYIFN